MDGPKNLNNFDKCALSSIEEVIEEAKQKEREQQRALTSVSTALDRKKASLADCDRRLRETKNSRYATVSVSKADAYRAEKLAKREVLVT